MVNTINEHRKEIRTEYQASNEIAENNSVESDTVILQEVG